MEKNTSRVLSFFVLFFLLVIFAAANEITAPKEVIILAKSGHQNEYGSQEPFFHRAYYDWLPALKEGKPAPVNQSH